jgi:hypothetical protein
MLQGVLAGLGAALASPVAARAHPMYRHLADATSLEGAGAKVAGSDWAPEFLAPHQNDTLSALAEGVVPGSTRAQVNRVIDLLLTVETAENRQKFAAALTAVDSESKKRFSRPIADLPAAQLAELLSAVSTAKQSHPPQTADSASIAETNQNTPAEGPATLRDHFENLKGWIVATYYSSEPGMRELGWTDEFYFEGPPECTHPEGHP